MIQTQIEEELAKRKDHRWEDMVDVSIGLVLRVPDIDVVVIEPTSTFCSAVFSSTLQVYLLIELDGP